MISRREFCLTSGAALAGLAAPSLIFAKAGKKPHDLELNVAEIDRTRVVTAAQRYLHEEPITVTASSSARSTGGKHDYFSEGDYWWPDPKNPDGPYIQRDGMSNPDNFNDHRLALIRLSLQVPALAAAWLITKDERYATHAAKHLRAWFLDESTRMNPHLQYAQAIHGRFTGRGTGIIDTIHLVEVTRAIAVLEKSHALTATEHARIRQWFVEYVRWMTTSKNGGDERDAKNNHGTCWVMQVAEFARYTGNAELTAFCKDRYKTVMLPTQFAANGSFPLELARTKPYSYSLFNLDIMSTVCQILSTPEDNLWTYRLADGRGMEKAIAYMYPFIKDKATWPMPPDVQYFDAFPNRQASLLFAGLALSKPEYLALWRTLTPDPPVAEAIRNFPVRQPVLWVGA